MNAPGFNAHRVRTPLRMIEQSHGGTAGVLGKWELYSRLRYLKRPVEFFVMPNIEQGARTTRRTLGRLQRSWKARSSGSTSG